MSQGEGKIWRMIDKDSKRKIALGEGNRGNKNKYTQRERDGGRDGEREMERETEEIEREGEGGGEREWWERRERG